MHRTEGLYNQSGYFTNGPPGTRVEEDWLNAIQEELAYVIEQAGVALLTADTDTRRQLKQALDFFYTQLPTGTVMLFGQNTAPTGWTRKTDWSNNAMLCYAATGNIGSGGSVNPQSTHQHTGPSHNHTTSDHTHAISAHTHGVGSYQFRVGYYNYVDADDRRIYFYDNAGSLVQYIQTGIYYESTNLERGLSIPATSDAYFYTSNGTGASGSDGDGTTTSSGAGNTGSGGTGNTGANTQPLYQEVIAATKD